MKIEGPAVTWRQVAAIAVVVAAGSASALVIVASVTDADALATVALALAIIAFLAQILTFIAQTWTTSQLNAETRAFLQELQSSAHGTERALNNQVDKLTDHLLRSFESARKEASSGTNLRQRVREDVAEAFNVSRPAVTDFDDVEPPRASPEDARIAEELTTFPPEDEGRRLQAVLRGLSPVTIANLRTYGEDERVSRQLGNEPGLRLTPEHPFTREAIDAGLLEYSSSNREWARLTEKGRQVVRLLMGRGEAPTWLRGDS